MIQLYQTIENLCGGNMLLAFAIFMGIIGAVIALIIYFARKLLGSN